MGCAPIQSKPAKQNFISPMESTDGASLVFEVLVPVYQTGRRKKIGRNPLMNMEANEKSKFSFISSIL